MIKPRIQSERSVVVVDVVLVVVLADEGRRGRVRSARGGPGGMSVAKSPQGTRARAKRAGWAGGMSVAKSPQGTVITPATATATTTTTSTSTTLCGYRGIGVCCGGLSTEVCMIV
jgi:hypothetical protein